MWEHEHRLHPNGVGGGGARCMAHEQAHNTNACGNELEVTLWVARTACTTYAPPCQLGAVCEQPPAHDYLDGPGGAAAKAGLVRTSRALCGSHEAAGAFCSVRGADLILVRRVGIDLWV